MTIAGIRCSSNSGIGSHDIGLQDANNFEDIFVVVRSSVKESLGLERSGLELYLRDLPIEIGAFHKIGTNIIVVNNTLINRVVVARVSLTEIKSFVYSVLLHECLHSLRIYDELQVRRLTCQISKKAFGERHPASILAKRGPWAILDWGSSLPGGNWS